MFSLNLNFHVRYIDIWSYHTLNDNRLNKSKTILVDKKFNMLSTLYEGIHTKYVKVKWLFITIDLNNVAQKVMKAGTRISWSLVAISASRLLIQVESYNLCYWMGLKII